MSKRSMNRPRIEGDGKEDEKHAQEGQGGTRHGYRSSNEIEDMEIFDDEPGKDPSEDGVHDANSIDENRFRERK